MLGCLQASLIVHENLVLINDGIFYSFDILPMHCKLLLLLMNYVDFFFDESLKCLNAEIIKFLDFPLFLKVIICSIHHIVLIVATVFSIKLLHIILIIIWVVNRLRHAFLRNGDRAIHKKSVLLMTSSHSLFI